MSETPAATKVLVQNLASTIGLQVSPNLEDDYTEMLSSGIAAMEKVVSMDDFLPTPELKRFPRKDVYRPSPQDNPFNAWATKATVKNANEEEAASGMLYGKTVVLKDNIALAGVPCEFGTSVFSDWVPTLDATVVTRILQAGGTITGKATWENFCAYGVSNTAAHGPVGNPYDKTRSSGGSSSGCGVLVCVGEADMAIGADQGGSIRIPASHVGIVGLKPTFGLVPYTGIISNEISVDHTGPMTRDVMDNALLLQVIAGVDGMDDRQIAGTPFPENVPKYYDLLHASRSAHALLSTAESSRFTATTPGETRKVRIGILKEGFEIPGMDGKVAECVRRAIKQLEDLGAEVVTVTVPEHLNGSLIGRVHRLTQSNNLLGRTSGTRQVYLTDLTEKIVPWSQEKFDKLFSNSAIGLIQGLYADKHYPQLHGKTHNLISKLRFEYDTAFRSVDILAMPTLPWVAKVLLPQDAPPLSHFKESFGLTGNTLPFNLTGHPALSIPCGMVSPPDGSDLKLPVGLQLVGQYFNELTLYKAALAWSDVYDWRQLLM
ncbi:Amidase signature (AS) superfamily protein [Abortiporus biennis]